MIVLLICLIIAYLIGSINSAIILCRLMNYADPRQEGSHNPGATNVYRIAGRDAAIMVFVGDALKGWIPVFLAASAGMADFGLGLIALAAVIGHVFPVFYNFRGGKGVATTIGALVGVSLFLAIIVILIWGVALFVSRYVSLASLIAVAAAPILALISGSWGLVIPLLLLAGLIGYQHQENINRLQAGTENKVNLF
jgi:glycerol-3-phosphate acyltransferase PlsY